MKYFGLGVIVAAAWWGLGLLLVRLFGIESPCAGCQHPIAFGAVVLAGLVITLLYLLGEMAADLWREFRGRR